MSDSAQLLETHLPHLKYDAQEMYFADAAEMFTTSPGMRLRRAGQQTDFKVAGHGLDLAFLSADPYPGTAFAWQAWDTLGCPDRDYARRAAELHLDPNIANVVYGHVVDDREGVTWLQYWYAYFYNDYNLIGRIIKAGLHEGDWEMVQLRLGAPDGGVDLAVYAQHAHAEQRAWEAVEKVPGTQRPVVYPARGSHASYFTAGVHWTGAGLDYADGRRPSPEQRLVPVIRGDATRRWIRWLGHWGDTRAAIARLDSDSPRSPGCHRQWEDPLKLLDVPPPAALAHAEAPPPPAAPRVAVTRRPGDAGALLRWESAETPRALTITINSPDERDPPRTRNVEVDGRHGEVPLPEVEPGKAYDINVSVVSRDDLASAATRVDLPKA